MRRLFPAPAEHGAEAEDAFTLSPLGTAAWIAEKFWPWSDNDGDLDKVVSKDDLHNSK